MVLLAKPREQLQDHSGGGEKADKPSSVLLLFYCIKLIKALSGPIFLQQKRRAVGKRRTWQKDRRSSNSICSQCLLINRL